jgi:hypothetical protein
MRQAEHMENNHMELQSIASLLIVAASALYLVWKRSRRRDHSGKTECGDCTQAEIPKKGKDAVM